MRAHAVEARGFQWPESGPVEAPDWDPSPVCGFGLHGLLWGEGSHDAIPQPRGARWVVFEVDAASVVNLDGKAKAPRGTVVHVGTRESAVQYLYDHGSAGRAVVYGSQTAGDGGTATAGDRGTATAGYGGTATAGDYGTATAGHAGTATAGDYGTATAGYAGTATAGDRGTATAGYYGTATAGDYGTATAGYAGTATAGYAGTATAGDSGTATAGDRGTATAGDYGTLVLRWWDETAKGRNRTAVAYVGENGIEPGVAYRLDPSTHAFVRADGGK
jgi:hypothetical protein